jgi:hypothetical protein
MCPFFPAGKSLRVILTCVVSKPVICRLTSLVSSFPRSSHAAHLEPGKGVPEVPPEALLVGRCVDSFSESVIRHRIAQVWVCPSLFGVPHILYLCLSHNAFSFFLSRSNDTRKGSTAQASSSSSSADPSPVSLPNSPALPLIDFNSFARSDAAAAVSTVAAASQSAAAASSAVAASMPSAAAPPAAQSRPAVSSPPAAAPSAQSPPTAAAAALFAVPQPRTPSATAGSKRADPASGAPLPVDFVC